MTRKKQIIVGYGVIAKLAKDCGCNRDTVSDALKGYRDSAQADMIRKRAKEAPYYGIEVRR